MKYMGSKRRLAKDILPIILKDRKEGQWYIEPFVGGANLIDKVTGNRLGSDCNEYLIAYFQEIQKGWIPPKEFTEIEYNEYKKYKENYPKYMIGYVGFTMTFGAKFFGGWARGKDRNYASEGFRNYLNQLPNIVGIEFMQCSYDTLTIPPASIIYCDPPYKGTTTYNKSEFDYQKYYDWLREKKSEGHTIFCSEYEMPEDFYVVFEKEIKATTGKKDGNYKIGHERLYKL